jgi:hypothetical protein
MYARRTSHQLSPSPPTRIPQQTESMSRPSVNPLRAQSFQSRDENSNLFDPFVVSSHSDNESPDTTPPAVPKDGANPLSFRAPPELAPRPTGKLAHRRQSSQVHGSPTPTAALAVPRSRDSRQSPSLSKLTPTTGPVTPQRKGVARPAPQLHLAELDDFPICDDLATVSSPTTPMRESTSYPSKRVGATWQQTLIDDAPKSAPLSATFGYPFAPAAAFATPSPANRRRRHHRVPSEGVFAMSTDEDSSSESSDELKNVLSKLALSSQQRTPSPSLMDGMPAGFYAGSVFQNSPSPDELPVPAFRA